MVLVWTHPVCQCPSAALRRSRTPDRWRLRKHWRRSSPFPVLVVVSCAGPAWAGARSLHGYLRSGASGAGGVSVVFSVCWFVLGARGGGGAAHAPSMVTCAHGPVAPGSFVPP